MSVYWWSAISTISGGGEGHGRLPSSSASRGGPMPSGWGSNVLVVGAAGRQIREGCPLGSTVRVRPYNCGTGLHAL